MVAVGGSIGTGLLLGSAAAIEVAGPSVILSFLLAGFISWTVTMALGELSSTHPAAGSFGVYADLYLNQWAGFISRAGYWAAICRIGRREPGRLGDLHAVLVSGSSSRCFGWRCFPCF